jgi:hypothetical protein
MTELATVGGTTILIMLLAMWATRPDSSCVLTREPHRRLALGRAVDSEHLASDVREIERIARRYAAAPIATTQSPGGDPPRTSGLDDTVRQCEATLAGQLMTTHDVTADQVREAASRER